MVSTSALSSSSSSPPVWTCPTPRGVKFGEDPDVDADYKKVVAEPLTASLCVQRLFVFNDNFKHRNETFGGSGNGGARPYFSYSPRRAVGVSTGWSATLGGFSKCEQFENECIDLALDKVYLVAKEVGATDILFSCHSQSERTRLGVENFKPVDAARKRIETGLQHLASREFQH